MFDILQVMCIQAKFGKESDLLYERSEKFKKVFDTLYKNFVRRTANTTQITRTLHRKVEIPSMSDIHKLVSYLRQIR